ncbi:MAG: PHP domain-containing protein [Ostreibacterium sp.]
MNSATVDLHSHTTASDGALSPDELIALAKKNEVTTLAITDHDTISGYLSIRHKVSGINLIAGTEISTTWQGVGLHIVGLDFDPNHIAIQKLLSQQTKARQTRSQIIIDKLTHMGMPITLDELHKSAGHQHIGRPHIAQVMIDKGYEQSMGKVFKKYLGAGKIGDVKNNWASLPEVVKAIRDSDGIAVIAHPNKYKMTRSKLLCMIAHFIEVGGQGIEVISGKQHPDITEKLAKIAVDKGLYASIGSDFHRHLPQTANLGKLALLPKKVTPIWQAFH